MFDNDIIVDIRVLLDKEYVFYAHTSEESDKENEMLHEHTGRCVKHFNEVVKDRQLNVVFHNFERILFPSGEREYLELFEELLINTIVFHDLGKINPLFQRIKMENTMFLNDQGNISLGSEHSIISSIIYLEYFLAKSKDLPKEIRRKFRLLTYINAYVISKHHGNLGEFEKFLDSFDNNTHGENIYKATIIREEYKKYFIEDVTFFETNYCERSVRNVKRYKPSSNEEGIYLYAYEKLLYSLLVA